MRAKKPELAVKAYKDSARWNDAQRLAREFLPHKVSELADEHKRYLRGDTGPETQSALMNQARQLEEGREFSKAINAYLELTADGPAGKKDHDFLEEVWENAVKLAMNHVPERIHEVVTDVSKRLINIKRYAQAAELFEGIDSHEEAVRVYAQGGMWDQAKSVANSAAPHMKAEVERMYKQHLATLGDAASLVHQGDVEEGLVAYAQQHEWQKCLELAQQQGPHRDVRIIKYATLHGAHLIQQSQFSEAAAIFAKHGTSTLGNNLAMYRRVAKEILASGQEAESSGDVTGSHSILHPLPHLRSMLHNVVLGLRQGTDEQATQEFERLLWIAHVTAAKCLAAERGAVESSRKLAVTLLRYLREIPADKAFYEAGMACKIQGDLNMSFVFLNRYLDITEAVEEHEASSTTLDNSDFANTQIPFDFPLPEKQFLADSEREKVRDFVLELSMNAQVQQTLATAQLEAIFNEADAVRDSLQRNSSGRGNGELHSILQSAWLQITQR